MYLVKQSQCSVLTKTKWMLFSFLYVNNVNGHNLNCDIYKCYYRCAKKTKTATKKVQKIEDSPSVCRTNDDTNGLQMIQFDQTVSESQLPLGHQAFTMEDKDKDHIMKQRI